MPERSYRRDIDRAKGLAILLVVFGHLVANGYPPGNGWYDAAKDIVYSFHMPFFMYLSGYVFAFTGKHRLDLRAWPHFLRDRAVRLLAPFLLFGLLIVTGKYLSQFFLYVDDPPHGLLIGIEELFQHEGDEFAHFLLLPIGFLVRRRIGVQLLIQDRAHDHWYLHRLAVRQAREFQFGHDISSLSTIGP